MAWLRRRSPRDAAELCAAEMLTADQQVPGAGPLRFADRNRLPATRALSTRYRPGRDRAKYARLDLLPLSAILFSGPSVFIVLNFGDGLSDRMSTDEVGVQTDDSNRTLCLRIRAGDTDAEAILITRLQSGLRLVANRAAGGDFELSRDVCQDTLVILIRRLRTTGLDDPSNLEAFAAQTARNLVIAARRKSLRQRTATDLEALASVPDPRRMAPEEEASGRLGVLVRRLLAELPVDRDRAILTRFYLKDQDKSEICRDLNLSDLGFNQVIFRARNRLRQLLVQAGIDKQDLPDSESGS
jgi:RNA polymerase sigma-70 factor, ECF subfamily